PLVEADEVPPLGQVVVIERERAARLVPAGTHRARERAGLSRPTVEAVLDVVAEDARTAVRDREVVSEPAALLEPSVGRVTEPELDRLAGVRGQVDVVVPPAVARPGQAVLEVTGGIRPAGAG